jgi:hypothetical protein
MENPAVKKWENGINGKFTDLGHWLTNQEVMEGVSSVGEAINGIQPEDSGFSIVSWMTLGFARSG